MKSTNYPYRDSGLFITKKTLSIASLAWWLQNKLNLEILACLSSWTT